jgi:hypothetical protein
MKINSIPLSFFALAMLMVIPAHAGVEVIASKTARTDVPMKFKCRRV